MICLVYKVCTFWNFCLVGKQNLLFFARWQNTQWYLQPCFFWRNFCFSFEIFYFNLKNVHDIRQDLIKANASLHLFQLFLTLFTDWKENDIFFGNCMSWLAKFPSSTNVPHPKTIFECLCGKMQVDKKVFERHMFQLVYINSERQLAYFVVYRN